MLIAHPEYTYLANSGVHWLCRRSMFNAERHEKMLKAAEFFRLLWNCGIPRIAIENPVMHGYAREAIGIGRANQTLQPYEYGHPASKRTCLWLKNLPPLVPTNILPLPACGYWSNQTPSGQNKLGPSPTRAADRARTYQGIADAMADQWG